MLNDPSQLPCTRQFYAQIFGCDGGKGKSQKHIYIFTPLSHHPYLNWQELVARVQSPRPAGTHTHPFRCSRNLMSDCIIVGLCSSKRGFIHCEGAYTID